MTSRKAMARQAGLLYLPTVILAPFRVGVVADLFSAVLWIFIILALYRLLKEVNQTYEFAHTSARLKGHEEGVHVPRRLLVDLDDLRAVTSLLPVCSPARVMLSSGQQDHS